jgi:hypothetical protein
MEDSAARDRERETKQILRQVQEHLFHAHMSLGAVRENVGMVDVLHHPTNPLGILNYVTPRKGTAWVSGSMIERGLEYLHKLERTPRVHYIEGLFPPMFAKELRKLDLKVEREVPVMVYKPGGINGTMPPEVKLPEAPDGVSLQHATDQRSIELWWYVWRNAHYDVLTLGVEPLFVGRDMAALKSGQQIDILAYRHGFPVGVTRVSIHEQTAHILALAVMKEARTPSMTRLLQAAAMKAALERDCSLIFAPGESEDDRKLCREMGFVDFGSIVCYAAESDSAREDSNDRLLDQPVLSL